MFSVYNTIPQTFTDLQVLDLYKRLLNAVKPFEDPFQVSEDCKHIVTTNQSNNVTMKSLQGNKCMYNIIHRQ